MIFNKYYIEPDKLNWQGRIDDENDYMSFRWHQWIKMLYLNDDLIFESKKTCKNFSFLGFCCDTGVAKNLGRVGAAAGPNSIRNSMSNLPCTFSENTHLYDSGDILCLNNNLEISQNHLAQGVKKLLSKNIFPVLLGGGHEIAFGHFKGIFNHLIENKSKNPKIGIINFDAHFDLRPFDKGAGSGTMFNQIADFNDKNGIDFNYFCIGIQQSSNTVRLFKTAEDLKVKYVMAKNIYEDNLFNILMQINEFISKIDYIYITICSDVFSSAFAPGVSSPQPLGIEPEIALKLLKYILKSKKVISFDIAEISPRFDHDNQTSKLAAIIIYALINSLSNKS